MKRKIKTIIGAIAGDVIGSPYQFKQVTDYNFPLFPLESHITDDGLMTLAVAKALYICKTKYGNYDKLKEIVVDCMVEIGTQFPYAGFGGFFYNFLFNDKDHKPYGSYSNGAAMRISPVSYVAKSEEELIRLVKIVTEVSHNSEEGVKGATAIALGTYLAILGKSKREIRKRLSKYYPILLNKDYTIDNLIKNSKGKEDGEWITCEGSCPPSVLAFLESKNLEDCIRKAILLNIDSDTVGAMALSMAVPYYGINDKLNEKVYSYIPKNLTPIINLFNLMINV